ncbi:hypothetical protein [Novosphingobium aquae]|uniref:Phage gp6-like head-tail connector protein n=1 Tax=Novosphingobium aquae TaxID=3133435 RepID=A0ABU8SCY5_9SPHN
MEYTDKTAVQNYLLTNIENTFDTQLAAYITAMTEFIDQRAGYPIYRNAESTNLYDGQGDNLLSISPVCTNDTVTTIDVTIDGVAVDPLMAPYNSVTKRELVLRGEVFPTDYANVAVTGIHSFEPTLPEKIKWACTVLVAGIINQVNNQTEGVQSEKIGEYQVSYKDQAARADFTRALEIIDGYKRIMF